jgi:hypothetical protein
MMVLLCARFVLEYFAVDFIDQQVYRGIKILFRRFAVDIFAANMQRYFCVVFKWFDRQYDLRADDVIKMPQNTGHFGLNVFPDGWGDVKMVTGDVQVHCVLSKKEQRLCGCTGVDGEKLLQLLSMLQV